jgi:hypothetical protein
MSMENEWDPNEPEFEEADETQEDEAADEPSAEEQRIAALAEERAKVLATEEINKFKGAYSRRVHTGRGILQSRGEDLDEDGKIVIRDVKKFQDWLSTSGLAPSVTQTATTQVPAASQADPVQQAVAALGPPPDPSYDPEKAVEYARKVARIEASAEYSTRLKGDLDAALKPMQEALQRFQGIAAQPVLAGIAGMAKAALEKRGHGHLAEHPEFAAFMTKMVQEQLPAESWSNPKAIEGAALYAIPLLEETLPEEIQQRANEAALRGKAAEDAERRREAHRGAAPLRSNGGGRGGDEGSDEEQNAAAMLSKVRGRKISVAELRQLRSSDPQNPYRRAKREGANA